MHIPSQLDQNNDIIKRLVAEQLKRNAVNYNIEKQLTWSENAPNYAYTATGLDNEVDRDLTKKERLYRTESYERIKTIYIEWSNPLESLDSETQNIASRYNELAGHIGLETLDQENQKLAGELRIAFETLDIIDILDVGEQ